MFGIGKGVKVKAGQDAYVRKKGKQEEPKESPAMVKMVWDTFKEMGISKSKD